MTLFPINFVLNLVVLLDTSETNPKRRQPKRRHSKMATSKTATTKTVHFDVFAVFTLSPLWKRSNQRHTKTVGFVTVLEVSLFWLSPFWMCRRVAVLVVAILTGTRFIYHLNMLQADSFNLQTLFRAE